MAEHKTLAEALAAFQAEVPKMSKDETAKVKSEKANYTYGYAGLDQFVEIVEPVLGKHGLSVTSRSTIDPNGGFILEVSLLHESGERETAFWPLPDPRRVGPQDLGSAMTYGRRYLGWGLTGTFPGGIDDDGHQAQQTARESWDSARPERPANRPVSPAPAPAPKTSWTDAEVADYQAQQTARESWDSARPERPANRPVSPAPAPAPKTSWTDAEVADYQAKIATENLDRAVKGYDWMASKGLHNREVDNGSDCKTATATMAVRLATEALRPSSTAQDIEAARVIAVDRGLLKVQVSTTETLEEAIHTARELAAHAAVEQAKADTPDPQAE